MKFGKSLSNQIEETLPEWRDKFLSYKDLKKRLKLIGAPTPPPAFAGDRPAKRPRLDATPGGGEDAPAPMGAATTTMTEEEEEFMKLLEAELEKFNAFFLEKEEEYIIRLKELQDRVRMTKDSYKEELLKVKKEIVDFHGEMVLLENYSALNYTGLVKILKKYDKRTGALIRLPFIQKVLQQPFFTTDLLYKLVKECESMLEGLLPANKLPVAAASSATRDEVDDPVACEAGSSAPVSGSDMPELEEIEYMESLYMKSTVSALRVLKEIRSGSSTVSVFSLPPLQGNGVEERWDKVTVLEQAAK